MRLCTLSLAPGISLYSRLVRQKYVVSPIYKEETEAKRSSEFALQIKSVVLEVRMVVHFGKEWGGSSWESTGMFSFFT